ncbi:MAG TPA: serine/threonine-protein kinase [Streptosporangiaceae bacterium]|nr:serine/threonine-protein kinase [Streptosporangiaceae bacterium]
MGNVAPLLPGDPSRLGAYQLVGRIGQGGQGTVFLARRQSGEPVAIKLLRAEWTREPAARARFAREVAAAERVAPFCTARILDARLEGAEPFVVSEFIDGPSLQEVIATDGPLSGSALDRLAVGTATALSAIHQAGVIHRDFKPGNVLLGPDGPRVIDFGIARSVDATATMTSQLFGTPGYMAPELVRGEPAGPPADVFAWAATIAFAATGTPPFHAPNVAAIVHQLTQGEPDLGSLTGDLRGIVSDCLAKDPDARPAAIDLLMRLLQHAGPGGQVPPPAAVPAQPRGGAPAAGEPGLALGAAAGPGAVLTPPYQQAPPAAAWPTDRLAPPGPGGRGGAGWVIVLAGLVALGIVAGLLVPVLLAGPGPAVPAPTASIPVSALGRQHAPKRGRPAARPAAPAKATTPASRVSPANAIPLRFAGAWRGVAVQPDGVVRRWAAVLVLPAGAAGGTFAITTIPCYATASVVADSKTQITVRQTLSAGVGGECAASGYISLRLTGLNRAVLVWQDAADSANTATGTFVRV